MACRHHIMELVLKAAFTELFGDTTGPDEAFFKFMKPSWSSLNLTDYSIQRPGAYSHTRLMSKAIFTLELTLLQHQFPDICWRLAQEEEARKDEVLHSVCLHGVLVHILLPLQCCTERPPHASTPPQVQQVPQEALPSWLVSPPGPHLVPHKGASPPLPRPQHLH